MNNVDLCAYHYKNAILPNKFTICGVELKPFCLGHLMLLEHLGNPIINIEETDMKMEDAIYWFFHALLVCGLSYEDNIKILEDDNKYKKMSTSFCVNLMNQMKNEPDWNLPFKLSLFKKYIKYYMDMPIYTNEGKGDEGTPSGSDWKMNIMLIFRKMGYKEDDILNMNFKKLFYEWTAYAEAEGSIIVINKIDKENLERMKQGKL
jgi:hypothetical protein